MLAFESPGENVKLTCATVLREVRWRREWCPERRDENTGYFKIQS